MHEEYQVVELPASEVAHIDSIVQGARGTGMTIKGEKAWNIVFQLFHFWASWYPHEYLQFKKDQQVYRAGLYDKKYARIEGDMEIRQVVNIPPRFMRILKAFFPNHNFHDKMWMREFARKMPLFQVPERL